MQPLNLTALNYDYLPGKPACRSMVDFQGAVKDQKVESDIGPAGVRQSSSGMAALKWKTK